MTPLESRKQLLILESELNRAQLLKDLDELKAETEQLAEQARSLASLVSSATSVFNTIFKAQQVFSGTREKFPRFFGILKGARAGASLWSAVKSWLR
jgi:hypothetical protein